MVSTAVESELHRVLAKSAGQPLKLSKVQNKVQKRLHKDHQDLTGQQIRQLLQQVLSSSRQFVFDGKKVQLASAPVAAAPVPAPGSPAAAATAAPATAGTGSQAGDKRPRSDSQEHKQRKKHKAAKQLEQQQQQHTIHAAPQHDTQAASHAVLQQQRHLHIKQEKHDHHVQQSDRPQHHQQQQLLLQPGNQAPEQPTQHKQHKHQQPKAPGHITASAAHLTAADNALRVEKPADQQIAKSKEKRKHKRKQPDAAAGVAVPLPQDGEQQQQEQQEQQQQAASKQQHNKRKQEGAGPAAAAAAVGDVQKQQQQQQHERDKSASQHKQEGGLIAAAADTGKQQQQHDQQRQQELQQQQHKPKQKKEKQHKEEKRPKLECPLQPPVQSGTAVDRIATTLDASQQQQQKQKKRKRQAEQQQPAVQSAEANGGAERQTDTSPGPTQQQQQGHEQQKQQKKREKKEKKKLSQHIDKPDDQPHVNSELQGAKTAAAACGAPPQQHNQQQQQQRSAAASSAREVLLQVMKGFKKQSTPAAAAATAAFAAAPLQQQPKASRPIAARHTVLAPAAGPSAAAAAAGALAAVQNRIAAQQQLEESDVEDSPVRRRRRRSDTWRADYNRTDIKHGRFSEAERKAVHAAIVEFAEEKGLPHGKGECGWLIDRKSAALKKGATTAIAAAIPHRTRKAVWQFVQANYTPVEAQGPFTPEEDVKLLDLYNELGPRWKEIGGRLGRLDRAVKDRAKALNFGKAKAAGRWTQEEIDTLQSFVSAYHQALEASGSAEGDVRRISKSLLPSEDAEARPVGNVHLDDIDWEWVSGQMGTRTAKQCAERWHKRMAPSMINSGQWAPGNDTTMIQALSATPKESWQVNWEDLVPGRTAQQCKRRWQVILRHLPVEVRNDFPKAVAEAAARLSQKQQKKNKKRKTSTDAAQEDGGAQQQQQ